MTTIQSDIKLNKTRKLMFQLVTGGIFGGLVSFLTFGVLDAKNMTADQIIVCGIGLMYLLMGLLVGFGLIAPKLGSNILNVEDAHEIRDQRRILLGSTICMLALGAALFVLPLAGSGGPISPFVAIGSLIAALFITTIISILDWKLYDEMLLQLSRDAGNFAFIGIGSVLLVWSSAAWLGLAVGPTQLELVALFSGGYLLTIFLASARKGLLVPR
jgi:hypothetical protein